MLDGKNNLKKRIIYFDNAATSWPKPESVIHSMKDSLENLGGSPGRSGHILSINSSRMLESVRESLGKYFKYQDTSRIIFTKNITEALNNCIFSLVKPGDHVITSSMEHNSVMRPLRYLEKRGVQLTIVKCYSDGLIDPENILKKIKKNTALIAITHASNVTGRIMPAREIADISLEKEIPIVLDCAQTAGAIEMDIDLNKYKNCIIAFTGHKNMFGPTGTGGMCIGKEINIEPIIFGGTGSESDKDQQPKVLPDRLESGTINITGLVGLKTGIDYILEKGINNIRRHEIELLKRFLSGLGQIKGSRIYGPADPKKQVGLVSFNLNEISPSEVGFLLDRKYSIMCRVGLHCNPNAHKTIGTFPQGTVRFGFSYFNNIEQIDLALKAIREIIFDK